MIRVRVLPAAVTLMLISFGGFANAAPPNQSDVDACNQELAAAGADSAPALGDAIKSGRLDQGASRTNSTATAAPDERQSDRSIVNGAQDGASDAASRSAFASCLARHGYYKGYYHH